MPCGHAARHLTALRAATMEWNEQRKPLLLLVGTGRALNATASGQEDVVPTVCSCSPGWTQDNTVDTPNDCRMRECTDNCNNAGDCVNSMCECFPGAYGDACEYGKPMKMFGTSEALTVTLFWYAPPAPGVWSPAPSLARCSLSFPFVSFPFQVAVVTDVAGPPACASSRLITPCSLLAFRSFSSPVGCGRGCTALRWVCCGAQGCRGHRSL